MAAGIAGIDCKLTEIKRHGLWNCMQPWVLVCVQALPEKTLEINIRLYNITVSVLFIQFICLFATKIKSHLTSVVLAMSKVSYPLINTQFMKAHC